MTIRTIRIPILAAVLPRGPATLAAARVSVARVFELPGDTYSDLTVQVFRGKTAGLFDAPTRGNLAYNAQYRLYRDFGDDNNVEVGASWGHGFNGTAPNGTTTAHPF